MIRWLVWKVQWWRWFLNTPSPLKYRDSWAFWNHPRDERMRIYNRDWDEWEKKEPKL